MASKPDSSKTNILFLKSWTIIQKKIHFFKRRPGLRAGLKKFRIGEVVHPLSSVLYWLLTPSSFTIKQISAIYHHQVSRVWVTQRVRQLRQKLIQRHREHAKKSFSTKSSGASRKYSKLNKIFYLGWKIVSMKRFDKKYP